MSVENEIQKSKKKPKKGIIYLSSIPPNMNVIRIREYFEEYGKVGRIFLQPGDKEKPNKKSKRNKHSKYFSEGWIEFEKKSIAKKVALFLNNKQVSMKKNSKLYDCIWNIKYLSNFKWVHLNERLAYERAIRKQKLRAEVAQIKKQANFLSTSIEKSAKQMKTGEKTGLDIIDWDVENINEHTEDIEQSSNNRKEFLKTLFS